MSFIGSVLKKGIILRQSLEQKYSQPFDLQKSQLKKLMIAARNTRFGEFYNFDSALWSFKLSEPRAFYLPWQIHSLLFLIKG